jgi:tetratricopeptide (TPR) repeat protein
MSLGDQDEALKELAAIRSAAGGLPELPPDMSANSRTVDLYMIRSFLDRAEWRRAADCCGAWLKRHGKEAFVHAMYAEALRNLHDYTAALNHLDRAVEMESQNIDLWYQRILVAWESENWNALNKALRMAANLGGDEELINRFAILLEAKTGKDDQQIISLLQDAIRGMGPDIELMYALGERYLKTGLVDLALSWFNKTITVMDRHERSWLGRIAALEALSAETYDDAAGLLSKAEQRKALLKAAEKNAQELRNAYDGYVERWNDNFVIRRERSLYLVRTFAYEDAAKELEALLARSPSNAGLRRVLSYTYRKTGRYREAAVLLKSLLKEKSYDIDLLLEYAGCLERTGAAEYAVIVLEKALERKTKTAAFAIPLLMALALLHAKDHQNEKAFDLLREAAALDAKDPRPYRLMAKLAAKNGSREDSKKFEFEADKREKLFKKR